MQHTMQCNRYGHFDPSQNADLLKLVTRAQSLVVVVLDFGFRMQVPLECRFDGMSLRWNVDSSECGFDGMSLRWNVRAVALLQ